MTPLRSIYDELPAVRCDRSGDCCRAPGRLVRVYAAEWRLMREAAAQRLTEEQRREIAGAASRGYHLRRALGRITVNDGATFLPSAGGAKCFFYDEAGGACRVYEARPFACRQFGLVKHLDCGRVRLPDADAHPSSRFPEDRLARIMARLGAIGDEPGAPPGRQLMEYWLLRDAGIDDPTLRLPPESTASAEVLHIVGAMRRGEAGHDLLAPYLDHREPQVARVARAAMIEFASLPPQQRLKVEG
ncbi:MAG: YkgJ family cysteine cluster protein [Planctomycetes bacterium]|nr:YkgJ family cysteine cluster protein [Planctomycetota bacterium]